MNNEIWVSLKDVQKLLVRYKKRLFSFGLMAAIIGFCYFVVQEPVFVAHATFKQGTGRAEPGIDMKNLFRSLFSSENESSTTSTMLSHTLLKRTIEELGWQGVVKTSGFLNLKCRALIDNLKLEAGLPIADPDPFLFKKVKYEGEKPLLLSFRFSEDGVYEVFDAQKKSLGTGLLGKPFSLREAQFTLEKTPHNLVLQKVYALTLTPWRPLIGNVEKKLSIKPTQLDKNILQLRYAHRNRHLAATFLNQMIVCYQDYLREETQAVADAQLKYLDQRQDELNAKLDKALDEHVAYLKNTLGGQGFISLEQEVDLLSHPQELFTAKLFDVEFELSRLEKLAPIQLDPSLAEDLASMNSETAKNLHLQYTNLLDSLHATLKQLYYIHGEMKNPGFELSSLSNVLTDPITQEMVQKAASFELGLHDELNRSDREQQRIREALATQKKYIASHILQSIDLHKIRLELTKNKLLSLQHIMQGLLKNEKGLIEKRLAHIREKMTDLPEKWRVENKLKLQTELTKGMMEGLTQITEAKNLSRHLYHVESRVLDPAFSPLSAKPPYLFLSSIVVALAAAISLLIYFLMQELKRGLPISLENLALMEETVCGPLSLNADLPLADIAEADLETLRKTVAFLLEGKKSPVAVLGKKIDFVYNLAELLTFHHYHSLVIDCNFDQVVTLSETPGLYHFLSGAADLPPIRHGEKFDTLPSGGVSRHGAELLAQPKLQTLLQGYDFIFLASQAPLEGAEAHTLLNWSEAAIIALKDETLDQIQSYREWSRQKAKPCVSFLEINTL